ncbi:kinase [Fusarium pseudoanthophilum]|uniref:Kinase n=1 Tax=Fusarium pseudoanthophilum TaxID=48495 RepID=A0A8H5KS37_9HYPO|nr:kinase [Fusarium pseudoanthophilum]
MNPTNDPKCQEAFSIIENEDLPHPLGKLLTTFISNALNPSLAATHVLNHCRPGQERKIDLYALISDWTFIVESITKYGTTPPAPDGRTKAQILKRDGNRCCITGKPAGFGDPLVVMPVILAPSRWLEAEPRVHEMLRAFFSPPYLDWWLAYTERLKHVDPIDSHWLVRRSAAEAYRNGAVKLHRLQPSMIEYRVGWCLIGTVEPMIDVDGQYPLLGDHSRSGIRKVDARFIGTQARLASSMRWLEVRKHIADNETTIAQAPIQPSASRPGLISAVFQTCLTIFWRVWLLNPQFVRLSTYKVLRKIGHHLYGSTSSLAVSCLPFGLYLKATNEGASNESKALDLVHRYTSVPVPRVLDLVADSRNTYLLTTSLRGEPLARAMDMFSDRDCHEFVDQMQRLVSQIRAVPPVSPKNCICNTLGQACSDPRIRDGDPIGPFEGEASFSQYLRHPDDPARRGHKIVFTHADLNLRNILVDKVTRLDGTRGWAVSGIVDWENSGFYPEYWDCTKAQFEGFRWDERWTRALLEVFRPYGGYAKEIELEKRSWSEGDGAF